MKVYVAGASVDLRRAELAIERLREQGHQVTHDWPKALRDAGRTRLGGGPCDADLSDEVAEQCARECLEGVASARVLWMLAPTLPSSGAWVELGFMLGLGWHDATLREWTDIVVSGNHRPALFCRLADAVFPTDEAALAWFRSRAPARQGLEADAG